MTAFLLCYKINMFFVFYLITSYSANSQPLKTKIIGCNVQLPFKHYPPPQQVLCRLPKSR